MMLPSDIERAKYAKVWALPEYSERSPGADAVDWLLSEWPLPWGKEPAGKWVLDVGCGTGKAGEKFAEKGCRVTLIDWGINGCAVPLPDGLPLLDTCLWHHWPPRIGRADLAFCVDVLEHLPTEFTMLAVRNMLDAAEYTFIQVAHFNDWVHGQMVREDLHLTIKPFEWWRDRLADLGAELIEARDCIERSAFLLRSVR